MILSERHRFAFIKGKKVAGTSVEVQLSAACGPSDIITPITPIDEQQRLATAGRGPQNYGADPTALQAYLAALGSTPADQLGGLSFPKGRYFNHMSLKEVTGLYGEIPADWTIFGVERCPYRKIISLANMELRFGDYKRTGAVMRSSLRELKAQIDRLIDAKAVTRVRNIEQYCDGSGAMRVEILRYESLGADLQRLCARLGISGLPPLPHLKAGLSSERLELREVFSVRQLQAVNELFADEFAAFGYEMVH